MSTTFTVHKSHDKAPEYIDCIIELLKSEQVQNLRHFNHHITSTRLEHSLNVSYYSYIISKKLGLDHTSSARAGLLHDLYFIKQLEYHHLSKHPEIAAFNAAQAFDINEIEVDAIRNHMWPLTLKLPKYKESYIVSIADKIAAVVDVGSSLKRKFNLKSKPRFALNFNSNIPLLPSE